MMYFIIAGLIVLNVIQIISAHITDERRRKYADELCEQWLAERSLWNAERQQLLDRIQAPSYDHLKHHEARIIKAQKEEPKEKTELEVV